MAKLSTEVRQMCPELKDCMKALDDLSYRRGYGDVFGDFIDWMVWQHLYPPSDKNPIEKYEKKDQDLFLVMFKNIQQEVRKRVRMWQPRTEENNRTDMWYDPMGRLYECISSSHKSSMLGQYFTPEPIVNMMTQITNVGERDEVQRILDPACGSGRMGLAAATYAMTKGFPCWVTMNDLDAICTKMTAINMCFHGFVGEVVCMNGLDIEGKTYRFGYRIEPILNQFPKEQWQTIKMITMMKTKQDANKQYVLIPITYEQTFLKQANDKLLSEYEERKKIANEEERQKAVDELKSSIQERMKGSLFEGDTSFVDNMVLPSQQNPKKKASSKPKKDLEDDGQGSLF